MYDLLSKQKMIRTMEIMTARIYAGSVNAIVIGAVDQDGVIDTYWSETPFLERVGLCESIKFNMTIENNE